VRGVRPRETGKVVMGQAGFIDAAGASTSDPGRAALDRTSEDARAYILRALPIRVLAVFLIAATSSGVAVLTQSLTSFSQRSRI